MSLPLIEAVRRLADVLGQENEALRTMDLRRATSLLTAKTAATADLTASSLSALGPPSPALVSTIQRLDGVALENRRLLERAIDAQQRVIGIVVRAVATAATKPSYGTRGRQAHLSRPMALSTRA